MSIGILSPELYSIVVLTAVVTSIVTPSLVRYFIAKVPPDPEEVRRLTRESAAAAVDEEVDLVVLATDLRPGSVRLHLGPQVEAILQRAPCPVLLLNAT